MSSILSAEDLRKKAENAENDSDKLVSYLYFFMDQNAASGKYSLATTVERRQFTDTAVEGALTTLRELGYKASSSEVDIGYKIHIEW